MKKSGIYLIRNIENNKKYVGSVCSSIGFEKRWYRHKNLLLNNKHPNKHLQSAWTKYGEQNFEFTILEECNDDMLIVREQSWISHHDSMNRTKGYNLISADRHEISEETRRKQSKSQSNRFKTKEAPFKGQKHSNESKKIMRLKASGHTRWLGKKHNSKSLQKMKDSKKIYWANNIEARNKISIDRKRWWAEKKLTPNMEDVHKPA